MIGKRADGVYSSFVWVCANTDPQRACRAKAQRRRDSIFTKGPSDVLDHVTSEIASGSKLGIDAT